jgi:two-component system sensor histidine kinase KdpD
VGEEYIAMISHDLRTPLAALHGNAQLLRKRLKDTDLDREKDLVEAILRCSDRMNLMIQELVDSSRWEAGSVELDLVRLDPNDLVSQVVQRCVRQEELARIQIRKGDAVPPIRVDPGRIEHAIANLVGNALKYAPPNSPVQVRVEQKGNRVLISVADGGPGIPPEDRARVFERMYRSQSAEGVEGLGLGLYISRFIVEAHDGKMTVESTPGGGSTFTIDLPAAPR